MPSHLKLVVEKHSDGYVAYPLRIRRGAILGEGDSYEDALADVRSAIWKSERAAERYESHKLFGVMVA